MMACSMGFRRAARALAGAAAVVGAVAAAALPAAADDASRAYAGAAAPLRFRAIKVDVSPLAGNGLGPQAEWIAAYLPGQLRAAFAGRIAPGDRAGSTLVVRIDQVSLGESNGSPSQPFGIYGASDQLEGVGMVVASNGKVVATYPLFTRLSALTGGSAYETAGQQRLRVDQLASSFAQWLPGKMGL